MTKQFRALVVDDEPSIRSLLTSALAREDFLCDAAENGEEAWERIQEEHYDLVVTDLAMPCRHGHSLATDLLALADRPLVVVLTGVLDPRIARDLMSRGIDDIEFKPVPMTPFAVKMRGLVDRRAQQSDLAKHAGNKGKKNSAPARIARITNDDFEAGLRKVSRMPPVSKAAIEVFNLTIDPEADVAKVAAAVQCEPALLTEILRVANSSFFNPSGKKISEADQAVIRLGQKRIGEVALATAAFFTLTAETVPFFSLGKIWKKSLAMGLCVEMLSEQLGGPSAESGGLFCAAVMQPMGRVLLASVFPQIYEHMIKRCEFTRKPLWDIEAQVFPETPGEVAAKLLSTWGIPPEIYVPLKYVSQPFSAIGQLSDPLRRRVELVKTAGFLGEIVADQFDPWDFIELPPPAMLKRLGVTAIDPIVKQCRVDLKAIASFGAPSLIKDAAPARKPSQMHTAAYLRLNVHSIDFMGPLLLGAGIRTLPVSDDMPERHDLLIVNAMNSAVHQVAARIRSHSAQETIILADAENEQKLQQYGRVLVLPCSYAALADVGATVAV